MKGSAVSDGRRFGLDRVRSTEPIAAIAVFALAIIVSAPRGALADEGGVSFWLPGFFGSLAAAPQPPGWSLTSIYYHTSVSAGADVARAREFQIGRIPVNLTANVSANLDARADLALAMPTYTFATPVFGGQLTVGAPMSGPRLGCAKTPAVAPHVEISPGNCIPESQIILHT
jgi:hypothetical protein